ncbi:MAG: phosphoenolpyruvate carboxykinase (ATP) [Bacteroidetes bacterium]|nr:phosphoenolpyruvate carboxykinase (ATP) [Bacteroidota bacterium]
MFLDAYGFTNLKKINFNLSTDELFNQIKLRNEGDFTEDDALVVLTGQHTGRSPNDKYIVKEESSSNKINWGKVNVEFEEKYFDQLYNKIINYFDGKEVFVQDLFGGADLNHRIPVRVITEFAWHNLFAKNLLIRPKQNTEHNFNDVFTIIDAPNCLANPENDGTRSEVFIVINFAKKIVLIGGTSYAGEIKKSVFSILNYLLPNKNIFPMHCSANIGANGDSALFFGLSGTGKTTLSADPNRKLIGDDEHGWSDEGIFNFEGGCYAKVIRLSEKAEPEIYATTKMRGTVLENVVMESSTKKINLDDASLTENTRAAYPLEFIPNFVESGIGGHPKNIIFLACDAFGVLPPISKLTNEQTVYHFLSGYTAKVAGTEKGVGNEPQVTFSTCFGAPFMPQHPTVYAKMLGEKLKKYNVTVWLVNTGWNGGPFGVGSRMKISYTRAMVNAALNGTLENVETKTDPFFNLNIPVSCPNVPSEILNPRNTWVNQNEYDKKANELVERFKKNFEKYQNFVKV